VKAFEKTIEIYDGNWCSHWVCPIGMVILTIGQLVSVSGFVTLFVRDNPSLPLFLGLTLGGLAIFFIGSCIGKEPKGGWQ